MGILMLSSSKMHPLQHLVHLEVLIVHEISML